MPRRGRPQLRLELPSLGLVDPARLRVVAGRDGPVVVPERRTAKKSSVPEDGPHLPLDGAVLQLAGASRALLALTVRWLEFAEGSPPGEFRADPHWNPHGVEPSVGEAHLVIERREARLLAALLRRHLARLPEPPEWMPQLLDSLDQVDQFLRWEDLG